MSNVAERLSRYARLKPDEPALCFPQSGKSVEDYGTVTFAELEKLANRAAHVCLRNGIGRGTRVLLMVPPGPEFVTIWFALLKIGAVTVLIDPGMGKSRMFACIRDAAPEALIAVPLVQILRRIVRRPFSGIRVALGVHKFRSLMERAPEEAVCEPAADDDTGAIVFTTGATGVPKGVPYSHRIMHSQIALLESSWNIRPNDVGLAAFLPFSLFCIAMGTCCVLPAIDSRRPADVDPHHVLALCRKYRISYSFGSPAFWSPVATRACGSGERFADLTRVVLFGAPVREEVVAALKRCLPEGGEVFTPYGATEALPLTSIGGAEILETAPATRSGSGVCVGTALSGVSLRIVSITDEPIPELAAAQILPPGEIGELVVSGPMVTSRYETRTELNPRTKIREGNSVWHRMGDAGYLDERGRFWFCGRVNHRVVSNDETLYSVCCEAIFNRHPAVARSALVGIRREREFVPLICIELQTGAAESPELIAELRALAAENPRTKRIERFLIHPRFPVDFRHNAKIIREELAVWAASQHGGTR